MGQDGTGRDGTVQDGTVQGGTVQDGIGAGWDRTGCDGECSGRYWSEWRTDLKGVLFQREKLVCV